MTIDRSDSHERPEAQGPIGAAPNRDEHRPRAGLDREARRRIGRNLRLLYADILDMPLPDRFGALLADLSRRPGPREIS